MNLDSESIKGGQLIEGSKQSETGSFAKSKFQGVSEERGKELSGEKGRSIYKLVFKKEGNQNENNISGNKSVKGSVGLVKIEGNRNGYLRGTPSLIGGRTQMEEAKNVGLIIAKSESSIYLIPVVRSSAPWSDPETTKKMKDRSNTKKVGLEGIKDIGQGTKEFDKSKEWKKERNDQLLKSFKTGFGIVRNGSFVFKRNEKLVEVRREGGKAVCYVNGKEREKGGGKECSDGGEGAKLYQNAGVLEGRGDKTPCSECKQAEKYFPLDIAVLGDQSNVRNLSNSYLNLIQELEVKDNITQVTS